MFWIILVGQLIGAFVGCLIGAYITGQWTETGRINAVTAALAKVVEQETAKAFAQERGKQAAMMKNLERLDKQMETLTTTQEEIKARISNEVWDRQWRLNRKEDLYTKLVDVANRLVQLHGQVSFEAEHGTMDQTKIAIRKAIDARGELQRLYAFANIFGTEACVEAIGGFYSRRNDLPTSQTQIKDWSQKEENDSVTLVRHLINAAKHDLGLES